MYTDTVSPHSMGMKFAIRLFGIDQVMYGSIIRAGIRTDGRPR